MNAWNEYSEFTDKCADVLNVQVMLLATSNACLLSKELEDFIQLVGLPWVVASLWDLDKYPVERLHKRVLGLSYQSWAGLLRIGHCGHHSFTDLPGWLNDM